MPRTPGPVHLAAWRAFLAANARVTDALSRELEAECGLPLTWYDVLLQLAEAGRGGLRMSELADAVLLSRSGLTRLVDRLVAAGLVERRPDPADRRATTVVLTPAGRRRQRRAAPAHLRGIERHFARFLSASEAEALRTGLARIARGEAAGR